MRTEKWDEEITSRLIYLVNPETNTVLDPETGKPPPPVTKYDVLNRIDRKTHRLVQVAEGVNMPIPKGEGEEEAGDKVLQGVSYSPFGQAQQKSGNDKGDIPVCKIISKKSAYESQKRRAADAKAKKKVSAVTSSVKTLELNWAIDANDLAHRTNTIKRFLEEGRKVEVVLAAKKRGRKASGEECEQVLGQLRGCVKAVEGAREVKALEGKMGGFAVLSFQGRVVKGAEMKEEGG
ncbi:hypothetical protein LTR37_014443 [Vermiconidia calcicola]|uniref:Uncharacterized protein n=1 Tax=Vermiconidia calcicola TaxID=1690605 RepID=A0ACC3MV38_9PEZI|nr:hypothetical protein LTR37_014443 [Vermiconidia calcicola]